jgi:DNA-directed RNA polymerase subunit N (RpoN/RPB10)
LFSSRELLKTISFYRSVRWHEACFHIPAVIREILGAYESQLVSDEEVERILDTLRTQMCCLSVCAAAWLRFYIQVRRN